MHIPLLVNHITAPLLLSATAQPHHSSTFPPSARQMMPSPPLQLPPKLHIVSSSLDYPTRLIIFHDSKATAGSCTLEPTPPHQTNPSAGPPDPPPISSSLLPIHARAIARAGSAKDPLSWAVTCRPYEPISVGLPIALINTRTDTSFYGIVRGVRTIERLWVEFWAEDPLHGITVLLSVPIMWATLPGHTALLHFLLRPWLSNTTPALPDGRFPPPTEPWQHCEHILPVVRLLHRRCHIGGTFEDEITKAPVSPSFLSF